MTDPLPFDPGPPLAARSGVAALYSVLSASFHLELLAPEDADRLAAVNDLVWDWIGGHLTWQLSSFNDRIERLDRGDLDFIPALTDQLDEPVVGGDAVWKAFTSQLVKTLYTDYSVACHGGHEDVRVSPFTYEFWAEIPDDNRMGDRFRAFATLRISVPDTWPLANFFTQVLAIASKLRLRWGSAGFSYAYFVPGDTRVAFAKMFAHARRFVGYDIPFVERNAVLLHNAIRSVNWLTFLGPTFRERLTEAGRSLGPTPLLEIGRAGESAVIRAGARPERGDVNRLQFPPTYVAADTLVRPIRLAEGKDLTFMGPWDERSTTEWLRRFERRTS